MPFPTKLFIDGGAEFLKYTSPLLRICKPATTVFRTYPGRQRRNRHHIRPRETVWVQNEGWKLPNPRSLPRFPNTGQGRCRAATTSHSPRTYDPPADLFLSRCGAFDHDTSCAEVENF